MSIPIIILVFLTSFISNFLYAMYVKNISSNNMLLAALYGEAIVILSALLIIKYVNNNYYLIPMIIGGFLGTLLTNYICKLLKQ